MITIQDIDESDAISPKEELTPAECIDGQHIFRGSLKELKLYAGSIGAQDARQDVVNNCVSTDQYLERRSKRFYLMNRHGSNETRYTLNEKASTEYAKKYRDEFNSLIRYNESIDGTSLSQQCVLFNLCGLTWENRIDAASQHNERKRNGLNSKKLENEINEYLQRQSQQIVPAKEWAEWIEELFKKMQFEIFHLDEVTEYLSKTSIDARSFKNYMKFLFDRCLNQYKKFKYTKIQSFDINKSFKAIIMSGNVAILVNFITSEKDVEKSYVVDGWFFSALMRSIDNEIKDKISEELARRMNMSDKEVIEPPHESWLLQYNLEKLQKVCELAFNAIGNVSLSKSIDLPCVFLELAIIAGVDLRRMFDSYRLKMINSSGSLVKENVQERLKNIGSALEMSKSLLMNTLRLEDDGCLISVKNHIACLVGRRGFSEYFNVVCNVLSNKSLVIIFARLYFLVDGNDELMDRANVVRAMLGYVVRRNCSLQSSLSIVDSVNKERTDQRSSHSADVLILGIVKDILCKKIIASSSSSNQFFEYHQLVLELLDSKNELLRHQLYKMLSQDETGVVVMRHIIRLNSLSLFYQFVYDYSKYILDDENTIEKSNRRIRLSEVVAAICEQFNVIKDDGLSRDDICENLYEIIKRIVGQYKNIANVDQIFGLSEKHTSLKQWMNDFLGHDSDFRDEYEYTTEKIFNLILSSEFATDPRKGHVVDRLSKKNRRSFLQLILTRSISPNVVDLNKELVGVPNFWEEVAPKENYTLFVSESVLLQILSVFIAAFPEPIVDVYEENLFRVIMSYFMGKALNNVLDPASVACFYSYFKSRKNILYVFSNDVVVLLKNFPLYISTLSDGLREGLLKVSFDLNNIFFDETLAQLSSANPGFDLEYLVGKYDDRNNINFFLLPLFLGYTALLNQRIIDNKDLFMQFHDELSRRTRGSQILCIRLYQAVNISLTSTQSCTIESKYAAFINFTADDIERFPRLMLQLNEYISNHADELGIPGSSKELIKELHLEKTKKESLPAPLQYLKSVFSVLNIINIDINNNNITHKVRFYLASRVLMKIIYSTDLNNSMYCLKQLSQFDGECTVLWLNVLDALIDDRDIKLPSEISSPSDLLRSFLNQEIQASSRYVVSHEHLRPIFISFLKSGFAMRGIDFANFPNWSENLFKESHLINYLVAMSQHAVAEEYDDVHVPPEFSKIKVKALIDSSTDDLIEYERLIDVDLTRINVATFYAKGLYKSGLKVISNLPTEWDIDSDLEYKRFAANVVGLVNQRRQLDINMISANCQSIVSYLLGDEFMPTAIQASVDALNNISQCCRLITMRALQICKQESFAGYNQFKDRFYEVFEWLIFRVIVKPEYQTKLSYYLRRCDHLSSTNTTLMAVGMDVCQKFLLPIVLNRAYSEVAGRGSCERFNPGFVRLLKQLPASRYKSDSEIYHEFFVVNEDSYQYTITMTGFLLCLVTAGLIKFDNQNEFLRKYYVEGEHNHVQEPAAPSAPDTKKRKRIFDTPGLLFSQPSHDDEPDDNQSVETPRCNGQFA